MLPLFHDSPSLPKQRQKQLQEGQSESEEDLISGWVVEQTQLVSVFLQCFFTYHVCMDLETCVLQAVFAR